LHEQCRGTSSERREGSLGVALHLAQLALILVLELVGNHDDESFTFLGVLVRQEFLPLLKLRCGTRATLDPVPSLHDVAVRSDVCSSVVALHAGEVLPLAW
jgi:hypothetical protein